MAKTISKPSTTVSKQEIENAMKVNLVDLALTNGIELEKSSANEYRLANDHSVTINTKKNIFKDFATNDKAGNSINFAQKYLGYEKFKDAVNYLNGVEIERVELSDRGHALRSFNYDQSKEMETFSPSKEYLTKERKINPMLVRYLHEKKYLTQNEFQSEKMKEAGIPGHTNLVMKWKYNDEIVGATEQGVHANELYKRNAWKGIQANSKSDHGFNFMVGEPKNVYFFESGIDAMSYATLKMKEEKHGINSLKGSWFVSMEGLKKDTIPTHVKMAFEKLNEGKNETDEKQTPNVFICVDNDQAGTEFYESLPYTKEAMPRLSPEYPYEDEEPKKWDWNDELKEVIEEEPLMRKLRTYKRNKQSIDRE